MKILVSLSILLSVSVSFAHDSRLRESRPCSYEDHIQNADTHRQNTMIIYTETDWDRECSSESGPYELRCYNAPPYLTPEQRTCFDFVENENLTGRTDSGRVIVKTYSVVRTDNNSAECLSQPEPRNNKFDLLCYNFHAPIYGSANNPRIRDTVVEDNSRSYRQATRNANDGIRDEEGIGAELLKFKRGY